MSEKVGAFAVVGEGRRGDRVHRIAVAAALEPIAHGRDDEARPGILADLRDGEKFAAVVEDADLAAVGDTPCAGVCRIDHDRLLARVVQLGLQIAVGRVQEGMALRRDHVERIAGREQRIGVGRLFLRDEIRQRIERLARLLGKIALAEQGQHHVAGRGHRGLELDLAGRGREIALAMRHEIVRRADLEARVAGLAQAVEVDAFEHWVLPVERVHGHLFVRALPVGIVEAHGARQPPEKLGIRHRLAARFDRRLVQREIQMAP